MMKFKHYFFFLVVIFFCPLQGIDNDPLLVYEQGEKASSAGVRKEMFYQSLTQYLDIVDQFPKDPKLLYNLANNYFQLEEYGMAIYYYEMAHALMPRNKQITNNLSRAYKKAQIHPNAQKVFLPLSEAEQIMLFCALFGFFSIFISIFIWKPIRLFKVMGIAVLATLCCSLGFIVFTKYMRPIEAIAVEPTTLRIAAGREYQLATDSLIKSGMRIRVLGYTDKGDWAHIRSSEGLEGYLPSTAIRLID